RAIVPWRRHYASSEIAPVLSAFLERHPKGETGRIERAFDLAKKAHQDQVRRSGDPYISHPLSVARILAGLGLDDVTIAAALLHRLGIQDVKWQLEDLSFAVLYPKRYAEIEQMVASRAPERDFHLREVLEAVSNRLAVLRIRADVSGRPKHYFSIYEKMVVKGKEFDEVQDLVAIRVVVDSVKDCYGALGSIHALWKPIQGRFKDYIAMPKFNLYQSLHTTVVGPQGKPVEVQIRTKEMHQRAEYGIAAHWG